MSASSELELHFFDRLHRRIDLNEEPSLHLECFFSKVSFVYLLHSNGLYDFESLLSRLGMWLSVALEIVLELNLNLFFFQVPLCLRHNCMCLHWGVCCGYNCDLYILGGGLSENPAGLGLVEHRFTKVRVQRNWIPIVHSISHFFTMLQSCNESAPPKNVEKWKWGVS